MQRKREFVERLVATLRMDPAAERELPRPWLGYACVAVAVLVTVNSGLLSLFLTEGPGFFEYGVGADMLRDARSGLGFGSVLSVLAITVFPPRRFMRWTWGFLFLFEVALTPHSAREMYDYRPFYLLVVATLLMALATLDAWRPFMQSQPKSFGPATD